MKRHRRKAEFIATLVFVDEPQVVHLMAETVPVIAIAVPSVDDSKSMFVAATVSRPDWASYLEGATDLRYLFTYPKSTLLYTFDLSKEKDRFVVLEPFEEELANDILPPARFFSTSHTEAKQPGDGSTLLMAHINSHALAPALGLLT